jgi:hypothetical protein
MLRRAPRPRGSRALGAGTVIAATLLAASLVHPVSHAQPAQSAQPAQPVPDLRRARDLYQSAEAAMKDGRFEDATRDYSAAYESSKDPALLWKIGHANEKAGKCDVALLYYGRYLRDGHPSEKFITMTQERIVACGGTTPAEPSPGAGSPSAAPTSTDSGSGSGSAAGAGSDASSAVGGTVGGTAGSTPGSTIGGAEAPAGTSSGSAALALTPNGSQKAAWLLTGGTIALITLGGVLAYAANSSENDVRDLYVGFAGQPATFDTRTRQRYDDLVDEGHRYQHLSWASFGLAGATAAGAAVLFLLGHRDEAPQHARITPVVTTSSAGLAVTF